MASSEFEFVQGNERLDWGVLVSIDVERLMKSTNVETLQRIVENIAFSRVTRDEAALFTPEHILHLFQLCQVVIQYLVYSQEVLAKMNVRLNDRMVALQATMQEREATLQRLSEDNSNLKKQVKTQRRTLLAYEYNAQAALARGSVGNNNNGNLHGFTGYVCPYCGEVYHKAESMQSHLRKRHNTSSSATASPLTGGAAGQGNDGAGVSLPPSLPSAPGPYTQAPPYCIQQQQQQPMQTPSTDEAAAIQQLRHRVEQLEKDKEVMERQQRENLILMMLGATRSQPAAAPSTQPPHAPASAPATPSAAPPASSALQPLSSSPLPGLSSAPASPAPNPNPNPLNIPDHLEGVPVMPDISAMMKYNISRQHEATENALRRQLVDLEAEVRALKSSRAAAPTAAVVPTNSSTPPLHVTDAETPVVPATSSLAVPRPEWVAELEHTQHSAMPLTPISAASPTHVVPSLTVPASPPPTPLPPAPASAAAAPPAHMYNYTTGAIIKSPAVPSVDTNSKTLGLSGPSPMPAPVLQTPPVVTSLSTPRASTTGVSSPVSTLNTQQQVPVPMSLLAAVPHPQTHQPQFMCGSNMPSTPIPAPVAPGDTHATFPQTSHAPSTTGVPSLPPPPSPEKMQHAQTKAYHWGTESTSSLSSASTVPPNRAVSRGPGSAGSAPPIVSNFPSPELTGATNPLPTNFSLTAPSMPTPLRPATATSTAATTTETTTTHNTALSSSSASVGTAPPLPPPPSTQTPPVAAHPVPVVPAPAPSATTAAISSYNSNISVINSNSGGGEGAGVGSYFTNRSAATILPVPATATPTVTAISRPGTSNSTTSTGSSSTNPYIHRNPPPPPLTAQPISLPTPAISSNPVPTLSSNPVPIPGSVPSATGITPFPSPPPLTPHVSAAPTLTTSIPMPTVSGLTGTSRAAPVPVVSDTYSAPTPIAGVPTVGASPPSVVATSASAAPGVVRPYQRVSSSSSDSSTASGFSLGGGYEY